MADDPESRPLATALKRALKGGFRLFTLRSASRADFAPEPELFALLVAIDLVLLFVFAFAVVGTQGDVNTYELPRALLFVPLALTVGMAARWIDASMEVLHLPVALASAGLYFTVLSWVTYLLAHRQWLPFPEAYWSYFDYVTILWSAAVIFASTGYLLASRIAARSALAAAAVVILVLPALWMPLGLVWMPKHDERTAYATGTFHSLAAESSFYAQRDALERELAAVQPERPGVPDVYFVGAALFAGEDVFMKEVNMIASLFRERFDADGRIVRLVNNPKTIQEFPVASLTSLKESLAHVGSTMNVNEDLLVLYVTSHGSENHELAVDFRPLRFSPITPETLKGALDDSGIRWKVVVISACYSGGFVDALKDARTLVITAARADRASFGCGYASDATYLAQALFGTALRKTHSFEAGFAEARTLIQQWEREKSQEPSEPQIHVGAEIRGKLAQIEKRLAARR